MVAPGSSKLALLFQFACSREYFDLLNGSLNMACQYVIVVGKCVIV